MVIRVVMLATVIGLGVGFVWSATQSKTRVVLIEAETEILTLRSLGQGTAWYLPGAIVCAPREDGFDPSRAPGEGVCDERRFAVADPADLTLDWVDGDVARVTIGTHGLVVTLETPQGDVLVEGTRIIVPRTQWSAMGTLTFAAEITVGRPVQSGVSFQLLSGQWEMRQSGWAIAPSRDDVTEVVKTGTIMRGAVIQVWDTCPDVVAQRGCGTRAPATVYGHFIPIERDRFGHIDLVAYSAPGRTELLVEHFGATDGSVIRPSLLDIAITSPLLLALAFVFSIIASAAQVVARIPPFPKNENIKNRNMKISAGKKGDP
jgi:hypothetical protein